LLKHPSSYDLHGRWWRRGAPWKQGFTTLALTLRDRKAQAYGDVGIKEAINADSFPGRDVCGDARHPVTGGYPLEGYNPDMLCPRARSWRWAVELRKITRQQLENGADWIKVYMTHRSWVDKQGKLVSQPTLTTEELRAVTDEAHGQQKKVACHATAGSDLHRALDGGCDSIEHGLSLDDAAIAQMLKQGTWFVPTLGVYYTDWSPENTQDGKRDRCARERT